MIEVLSDKIVVRPNDRLIRSVVICMVGAWLIDDFSFQSFMPLLLLPFACFLVWLAIGRSVFRSSDGDLTTDHCLGSFVYARTSYPIAAIRGFRVEEDRRKIKGALSVRYHVLMDAANGTNEIAWFRDRADAETLATKLSERLLCGAGALAGGMKY